MLDANDEILKHGNNDPGVGYIDKPNVKSQGDLLNARKKELRAEFQEMEKKQGTHVIGMDRLNFREECLIREGYKEPDNRLTAWKIAEKRRKEDIEYNMNTFGKQSLGVHGQDLP